MSNVNFYEHLNIYGFNATILGLLDYEIFWKFFLADMYIQKPLFRTIFYHLFAKISRPSTVIVHSPGGIAEYFMKAPEINRRRIKCMSFVIFSFQNTLHRPMGSG